MKIKLIVNVIILLSCLVSASAQTTKVSGPVHHELKLHSRVLNEDRTVLVRVPESYSGSNQKYPVLFMLDGHEPIPSMMAGILDYQVWSNAGPEMILVSIPNTNRTRDMTPTKTERASSGGGEAFLDFIEKEVIPMVEKNYRTQPYKIFAGHSLAGLAVVNSLVSRPDLFDAYIAASPVLHWDDKYVIRRAEEVLKENRDWNKTVFIALGDEPAYTEGFNAFRDLIGSGKPKGLEIEMTEWLKEDHDTIVLPTYYYGLRKIYEGWRAGNGLGLEELKRHYEKLSTRFKYRVNIPEDALNRAGYRLMGENKMAEAIDAFKLNVENHPHSANVYDSLGEAYEKAGKLELAKQNYEKAFLIAKENGDERRAPLFKANLDRVLESLQ